MYGSKIQDPESRIDPERCRSRTRLQGPAGVLSLITFFWVLVRSRSVRLLLPLCLLASCSTYWPDAGPDVGLLPDPVAAESDRFRSIADAYLAWHYAAHPTAATFAGIHDFDGSLGRHSRAAQEERREVLREYRRRLSRIDANVLEDEAYYDYRVLHNHLRARLLELERVRSWERNPNYYREILSNGLYSLAALTFDTPRRRMALAAQRLEAVPDVLRDARDTLADPAAVHTEVALEGFQGTLGFFRTGLTQAFEGVEDPDTRKTFEAALAKAAESIDGFIRWLKDDLLKRSKGPFALGADVFREKLRYEEMVTTPLEALLKDGYALLQSTQAEMKALAGGRSVREALREAGSDHPEAEGLLDEARGKLEEIRKWASGLVDIPREARCRVQETPAFRRSLSFASMRIPGPFERVATEAYYSITLPDPSWPDERKEQHLSFFNRTSLPLISVHEAYPGHYTQFLAVQGCPSKIRKAFGCASFSEGWAHYCEQLYVETHDTSPAARMQMLSMALLRICRYLVGIEMHAGGMSLDQGIDFFMREGYLERANAVREARRGTQDPTYLVYTLGKSRILKLREEYLERTGKSLRDFHNEFIRHGYPPIPVLRMILLGERPRE